MDSIIGLVIALLMIRGSMSLRVLGVHGSGSHGARFSARTSKFQEGLAKRKYTILPRTHLLCSSNIIIGDGIARPQHIAFIVDGNGRWATDRGMPRKEGHAQGASCTVEIAKHLLNIEGIEVVTFYLFSSENWSRPVDEIDNIMRLLERYLKEVSTYLMENRIKLVVIGELERLPSTSRALIKTVEASTAAFDGDMGKKKAKTLVLALSYGGRWDVVNAVKSLAAQSTKEQELTKLTEEDLNMHLSLGSRGIPDPDVLVRTGGEQRVSNFLLWQISYSEIFFLENMWPDFTVEVLEERVLSRYAARSRRFGGTTP